MKLLQKDAKTRSRRAAYSFPITQLHNEQYLSHVSSAKMIDPYTWPDSVAPSRDDSPVPLRPLPIVYKRVRLAVPASSRILRTAPGTVCRPACQLCVVPYRPVVSRVMFARYFTPLC